MAKHIKRRSGLGTTVCVAVMFVSCVWYILYQSWFYLYAGSFLPMEVTYGFFAVFCFETVSLARLSMAKQRGAAKLPERAGNPALEMLGLYSAPDFEPEVKAAQDKAEQQGMDTAEARAGA